MHTALLGITSRTVVKHQERDTHTLACDLQLCKTKSAMPTALIGITSLTVVMHAPGTGHSLGSSPMHVACNCARQTVQRIIIIIIALNVVTKSRFPAPFLYLCHKWLLTPYLKALP